jgi:hypothetical protein
VGLELGPLGLRITISRLLKYWLKSDKRPEELQLADLFEMFEADTTIPKHLLIKITRSYFLLSGDFTEHGQTTVLLVQMEGLQRPVH